MPRLKTNKLIWLFFFFCIVFAAYYVSIAIQSANDCLSCHNNLLDLNLDKKFLHPLVKDGKCKSCHISYDETAHVEKDRPVLAVCLSCHSEEKLGRSHPVGEGIIDPNTKETMTCVSTCHIMHGSDYKYQLPFKNNMELCLSCHKEF